MSKSLVIVESPAKARTIGPYLGSDYRVESSIGHIRDLPRSAADVPEKYRGKRWARLGVDVEDGFRPLYVISADRKRIADLRRALRGASELVLATDEDREGEAIAWHLKEVLRPKVPVRRMVFHEITKSAIGAALRQTREIDDRLVAAQEARRVLDRLYGYDVSPVLWRKVRERLSAGRVQSVATRLVVSRERERIAFVAAEYWSVEAELQAASNGPSRFRARVTAIDGRTLARGQDFDRNTGRVKKGKRVHLLMGAEASTLSEELLKTEPVVTNVRSRPFTRRPYAPFITSTLQQEAARKLRFPAQRTMRVAQGLYENGYITYMRTDSTALSAQAIRETRRQITRRYGKRYLPAKNRVYARRANAQEAHEAIRPAGTTFRGPAEVRNRLDRDSFRLYELIWKRTLASQMKDARGTSTTVQLETETPAAGPVRLTASGRVLEFDGFLRVYVEGRDDPSARSDDEQNFLPALRQGQRTEVEKAEAKGHRTQPPVRYTEASLVREMEEQGIGRPSTYAATLQTIVDRGYVWKKGSALVPTFLAFGVTQLLEKHLDDLVDLNFTARMEADLDEIARGERDREPWLRDFYFGRKPEPPDPGRRGLRDLVSQGVDEIDARAVCSVLPLGKDDAGRDVLVRVGRYGAYVQAGDDEPRASFEDEVPPDEVNLEWALDLLRTAAEGDRVVCEHPETGEPIYVRTGRYGDYVQVGEAVKAGTARGKKRSTKKRKPKTASLWPSMKPATLTPEQALQVLSFPKELGRHPETGEPVRVQDGRFGPYVRCGKESRSLTGHEQLATITLDEALRLLRQPKRRGRASTTVIRTLGDHPVNGLEISVKSGRFGPYVTDGQVNATVPKGREPTKVDLDEAVDLLAAREARLVAQGKNPRAPRRRVRRRRPAKKAARRR